jgi:hypothetical protein
MRAEKKSRWRADVATPLAPHTLFIGHNHENQNKNHVESQVSCLVDHPIMVSSEACKAQVKVRKQRHLRKLHRKTEVSERTPMHKSAGTPTVESVKDVLRDSTTLASPRDENLDATKLYAHSYRENGRFGSHPSHDGFDDESGPE